MDLKVISLGQITRRLKPISAESCMLYVVGWGFVRMALNTICESTLHPEMIRTLLKGQKSAEHASWIQFHSFPMK